MILRLACLLLLNFILITNIEAQQWDWVMSAGQPPSNGDAEAKNVVKRVGTDAQGNIYASGSFRDFITLGNDFLQVLNYPNTFGAYDVFLCKMNPQGTVQWAVQLQGGNDLIYDMDVQPNGEVLIAGAFGSWFNTAPTDFGGTTLSADYFDGWYAKYDTNGNLLWAKQLGAGGPDFTSGITTDPQGNIYLTGYFNDTVTFGGSTLIASGWDNFYLAKADPNGNPLWAVQGNSMTRTQGTCLRLGPSGNIYVAGHMEGNASFGGQNLGSNGSYDSFLVKYTPNGNLIWAHSFGGSSDDFVLDMDLDQYGNAFLTGTFQQTMNLGGSPLVSAGMGDGFFSKFDSTGNVVWAGNLGSFDEDRVATVKADGQGGAWIGGTFTMVLNLSGITLYSQPISFDLFMFHLDANGAAEWGWTAGGVGAEYMRDIYLDANDNLFIGGYFIGDTELGNFTFNSGGSGFGNEDLFVAKVSQINTDIEPSLAGLAFTSYPNPFRDVLSLQGKPQDLSGAAVTMTDLQGRVVHQSVLPQFANADQFIYLAGLSSGIYLLRVENDGKTWVQKVVKE